MKAIPAVSPAPEDRGAQGAGSGHAGGDQPEQREASRRSPEQAPLWENDSAFWEPGRAGWHCSAWPGLARTVSLAFLPVAAAAGRGPGEGAVGGWVSRCGL